MNMLRKILAMGLCVLFMLVSVGCNNSQNSKSPNNNNGSDKAPVSKEKKEDNVSDKVTDNVTDKVADKVEEDVELIPVSFRLNYTASGLHAPFYMALEKGYYEEVGLDVTMGEGTGSGTTAKLVGTGSDDIGLVDSASVGSSIAAGIEIKIVAPIYAVNGFGVITLEENGINTPKDLEGKKVGIATGDGPSKLFAAVAGASGVDESKINFVTMDSNSKVTSLINGQVDAVLGGADNEAVRIKNMGYNVKVLRHSDNGAPTVGLSVIASETYIANNQETIKKFITATMRAWNEARDNPDGAVDYILDDFPTMDRKTAVGGLEVALSSLFTESSKTLGDLSVSDWEKCRDLLVEYMGIDDSLKATDLYTFECLPDNLPAR
ncbi:MAG: hypothetical protein EWM47_03515 [Anaerolineaceae bacterium]|nr:MAG: hypothetical protein EWM47_03515 [Anaerolineaceae bacterium]